MIQNQISAAKMAEEALKEIQDTSDSKLRLCDQLNT